VVLDSFKSIRSGVAQVEDHIELYRASVRRIQNRAVFEIPEILERISAAPARVGVDLAQHLSSPSACICPRIQSRRCCT